MSILDHIICEASTKEAMSASGHSLANSLYHKRLLIAVSGDLGVGKTTFIKGLAKGLGITGTVISPSYALEQQYGSVLSHIDLYRLSPEQAEVFMQQTEDFPGIRVIEWGERDTSMKSDIHIQIEERKDGVRRVDCSFSDIDVPSDDEIEAWTKEVHLPQHIVRHMDAVTVVADRMSDVVLSSGRIVRKKAVHAAAKAHDLLRFVDFKTWEGDESYTPTDSERSLWSVIRETYGTPHEAAATKLLSERGYAEIGQIISTHRGAWGDGTDALTSKTIEQMILTYADKRIQFDTFVTLDERLNELRKRYSGGIETPERALLRKNMTAIERELFDGTATF